MQFTRFIQNCPKSIGFKILKRKKNDNRTVYSPCDYIQRS